MISETYPPAPPQLDDGAAALGPLAHLYGRVGAEREGHELARHGDLEGTHGHESLAACEIAVVELHRLGVSGRSARGRCRGLHRRPRALPGGHAGRRPRRRHPESLHFRDELRRERRRVRRERGRRERRVRHGMLRRAARRLGGRVRDWVAGLLGGRHGHVAEAILESRPRRGPRLLAPRRVVVRAAVVAIAGRVRAAVIGRAWLGRVATVAAAAQRLLERGLGSRRVELGHGRRRHLPAVGVLAAAVVGLARLGRVAFVAAAGGGRGRVARAQPQHLVSITPALLGGRRRALENFPVLAERRAEPVRRERVPRQFVTPRRELIVDVRQVGVRRAQRVPQLLVRVLLARRVVVVVGIEQRLEGQRVGEAGARARAVDPGHVVRLLAVRLEAR